MPDIQAFIRYLEERHIRIGSGSGYSFVRGLPPNIRDTYFAMSSLKTLKLPSPDEDIVLFLSGYDHYDLNSGYFARKCLELAGAEVEYRDGNIWWCYLGDESIIPCFIPQTSVSNYFRYDLHGAYGENIFSSPLSALLKRIDLGETAPKSGLANLIHTFLKRFGNRDIMTLFMALEILNSINLKGGSARLTSGELQEMRAFLRRCTTRNGYTASPVSSSITIERVYAGHKIAKYLGLSDPSGLPSFINSLQNANGGFRRSPFGGISTLEYSCLAIRILSDIENKRVDGSCIGRGV